MTPSPHLDLPAPAAPDAVVDRRPLPGAVVPWAAIRGLLPARRGLAGLAFLVAGGLAWWWLATHHIDGSGGSHGAGAPDGEAGPARAAAQARAAVVETVALPRGADPTAIGLVPVEPRPLRPHVTVPGRLDYDARYRLDYAAPVDGIVSRVMVQVRQRVRRGDSLAEVSSPDVGAARNDVRRREDDRRIERKAADWATTIAGNVESLLAALAGQPPLEQVEQTFQDRVLGTYREKILSAYSRLLFVEKVNASTRKLGEGGVLSGRIVEERTSNLEVAKANFEAACEEALFLTRQERDRAQAKLAEADRLVQIAREHLRTLVGSRLEALAGGDGDRAEADLRGTDPAGDDEADGSLSSLVLRTPFDGVVEDVFVARGERVKAGDRIFVVADTATLWVRAQIHERQWTAVEVSEGQEVRVKVPGSPEHDTAARISHVGAVVEAESRSVPLVATLENNDAHYKPGMFVWVDLPQGEPREALTVPAAAVMRHAGRSFVFVPVAGGRYRRQDVETGLDADDVVEITRGLEAGQEVVSRGAFLLKSELLLEKEEAATPAG